MHVRKAVRKGVRLLAARVRGRAIPFHVTLFVTNKCNLRCVYCSSPEQRTTELTADEWCEVLTEFRALGTERILFFGGEPLLRNDLAPIVSKSFRQGPAITNKISRGSMAATASATTSQISMFSIAIL